MLIDIINIPSQYRTKEQDVRIELIKGFLNKSKLDYDELEVLFNLFDYNFTPEFDYILNDEAYNQFKAQFTPETDTVYIYGNEFTNPGDGSGIKLDKTYNEILSMLMQGKTIIVHFPEYDAYAEEVGKDSSQGTYKYYVSCKAIDGLTAATRYYTSSEDGYPFIYYAT